MINAIRFCSIIYRTAQNQRPLLHPAVEVHHPPTPLLRPLTLRPRFDLRRLIHTTEPVRVHCLHRITSKLVVRRPPLRVTERPPRGLRLVIMQFGWSIRMV